MRSCKIPPVVLCVLLLSDLGNAVGRKVEVAISQVERMPNILRARRFSSYFSICSSLVLFVFVFFVCIFVLFSPQRVHCGTLQTCTGDPSLHGLYTRRYHEKLSRGKDAGRRKCYTPARFHFFSSFFYLFFYLFIYFFKYIYRGKIAIECLRESGSVYNPVVKNVVHP